jgi:hypothetical protein
MMMAPVLSQKVVFMVCRLVLLTGFAALQKENTKLFTDGAKGSAAKCKYLSSGAMRQFSQLTYIAASPKEAENKESSKKDGKVDFGQAFSKNVRGAFM